MTIDKPYNNQEKHLESHKQGDSQVAGKPITNAEDNAHQQRLEKQTAAKAFRFTHGDNAFTIDMGDGKQVQDTRPKSNEQANQAEGLRDLVPGRMDEKTGKIDVLGKDGKWHPSGSIPHSQEMPMGDVVQDKNGNYHKVEHVHTSQQADGSRDLTPSRMDEKTGKTETLGKDGKWHKAGTLQPGQEATVGEYQQDKNGNWHKAGEQKHEQHDQSGKRELTGERGLESSVRPHPPNMSFNEKDHLWHDNKTNKVVAPPDSKLYGFAGALYDVDMLVYRAHQIVTGDN